MALVSAIPTLWRYFLWQYAKVFGLSLFGFLAILLATRLEDFARFITIGADLQSVLLYILLQIPYVAQIALPISSLIATLFLFQKLSQNQGLTALRAAGFSLFEVATPIFLSSTIFAIFTFYFLLDFSATAHKSAKELQFRMRALHPLAIIHNSKMLEQKGMSIEMKGSLQHDGKASDFIMAIANQEAGRTALLIAKEMKVEKDQLRGKDITMISTLEGNDPNHYDHMVIENSKDNLIKLDDLSQSVNTKRLRTGVDELKFSHLLAKKNDLSEQHQERKILDENPKFTRKLIAKCYSEIARRISLSLAIITFAILGVAYGSSIGRHNPRMRIIKAILLTSLFLISFLGAKTFEKSVQPSVILYFAPHLILLLSSTRRLMRLQKGVEV